MAFDPMKLIEQDFTAENVNAYLQDESITDTNKLGWTRRWAKGKAKKSAPKAEAPAKEEETPKKSTKKSK